MSTDTNKRTPSASNILFSLFLLLLPFGCAKKNFYADTPVADPEAYRQLRGGAGGVDSVTVQAGSHYGRGLLHRTLWGARNRKAWTTPVRVPVLDLDTAKGGLEVEKIGGGMQTINAAMEGGDGMTYSLRTVDKRSEKVLPLPFRKTFVANLVRDQASALNPYGALVVAPLAEAAGLPHATPRLVYVLPEEEALGEHAQRLSDQLYMLEEKYNDKRALVGDLERAHDIAGPNKMLNHRYGKDDHFIDQKAFARARLLDLLIGDWDRHVGQWEWAEYKENGEHLYRPIPKDRDNAFYRFGDGLFSWLFSRRWAFRKFESFTADYRDVKALMVNSAFIDARAMPELTRAQFDSIAHVLQQQITDEVIERAVLRLPEPVYRQQGEEMVRKLKSRRDKLDEAAREFYKILSKEVLVVGTDREDIFEVRRLQGGETEVTVRRDSDGEVRYHRVFYPGETKEIVLHGLAENDVFRVSGEADKGIKVKIVGGRGQDEVYDSSKVKGWGRKTWVYDTPRGTRIEAGPETKDKTSKKPEVNFFDREGHRR
ncbi:hypothetical protein [Pontibacter akesuensis]|uniref:Uncharacterized protein n=1 Tax=Pontibacter akesuensis TaxID=388950 RepID=A0A1I7FKF5_9BACT|nr:hypothetical protein [Pontibacter akesuensis]GHA61748.1 hypothetical protein GCM10007389_12870 [Pontibacter akesuensis]SFU36663.1 hypothetical protein SAMN04487941_0273 [Pontibacter akesuensis]